jgi:hypothetical protein
MVLDGDGLVLAGVAKGNSVPWSESLLPRSLRRTGPLRPSAPALSVAVGWARGAMMYEVTCVCGVDEGEWACV